MTDSSFSQYADISEVRTLAVTVDRWCNEIAAFIDTGRSNAKSEGINRVTKLVARAAFGFRNATNQRLRTRCVTTRQARGQLRAAQLRRPTGPSSLAQHRRISFTCIKPLLTFRTQTIANAFTVVCYRPPREVHADYQKLRIAPYGGCCAEPRGVWGILTRS